MHQPILPLNTVFGPYHLTKLLATSETSSIYLACQRGASEPPERHALKILSPEFFNDQERIATLHQKVTRAIRLLHPNLVQVYGINVISQFHYIAMEYVNGANLSQIVARLASMKESVPIAAALGIAQALLNGLNYLHYQQQHEPRSAEGQLNGDLCLHHVLISRAGEIKICHLTTHCKSVESRVRRPERAEPALAEDSYSTNRGIIRRSFRENNGSNKVATPLRGYEENIFEQYFNENETTPPNILLGEENLFVAPELQIDIPKTPRADIYTVGGILYQTLTGQPPSITRDFNQVVSAPMTSGIIAPSVHRPEILPSLDALVIKALAPDPNHRYQNVAEFTAAIEQYFAQTNLSYSPEELGLVVEATLASKTPKRPHYHSPVILQTKDEERLRRDDFSIPEHSLLFPEWDKLISPSPSPPPQAEHSIFREESFDDETPPVLPERILLRLEAWLSLSWGSERLTLPIGENFPITYTLSFNDQKLAAETIHIYFRNEAFWLEPDPQGKTLFHNGKQVLKPVQIRRGDTIQIGPLQLELTINSINSINL